jgi:3-oxoacyl-(acyl-carrier-protein) synthase/pimeloyl-ACP methyl ester carboxylesterase/acyl carrier protein
LETKPPDMKTLLKRALVRIEELERRARDLERGRVEPIAIVGIGCRLPGGVRDPESLWRLLDTGVDAVGEIPPARFRVECDPAAPEGRAMRWAALLDDVDRFDAAFFGISPAEAQSMDPQQRLLLEVAWEALERAAQSPDDLRGARAGVYVGIMNTDFLLRTVRGADPRRLDVYAATGNGHCFAAGRLAYTLGLEGPAVAVDTACSSSLVAVHLACQALRAGDCDVALAGGANVILSAEAMALIATTRALSPDGRCRAFDARASGYVRGEGCAMVVLRRLSDALGDGDPVVACILGSDVNQDGRSSGLTAPSVRSQEAVIRRALGRAGVDPSEVAYIETHGTGTPLGDPIEVDALRRVFGGAGPNRSPCALGALKTNIGHLEAAAGVAALVKAALVVERGRVPPNLHFRALNPRISLAGTPFMIPTAEGPWLGAAGRRVAGVSSFGLSGTNAHLVLAGAPPLPTAAAAPTSPAQTAPSALPAPPAAGERPLHVLVISARSDRALRALAAAYAEDLAAQAERSFPDVCHTAAVGRAHLPRRLAIVAATAADARRDLGAVAAGGEPASGALRGEAAGGPPRIAFVFGDDGDGAIEAARALEATSPDFRRAIERLEAPFAAAVGAPLHSVLAMSDPGSRDDGAARAALVALHAAACDLWRAWGVEPQTAWGRGAGAISAARALGEISLDEALRRARARERFADETRAPAAAVLGIDVGPASFATLLGGVARLYAAGARLNWRAFDRPYARRKVRLPTYPWQGERFPIGPDDAAALREPADRPPRPAGAELAAPPEEPVAAIAAVAAEATGRPPGAFRAEATLASLALDSLAAIDLLARVERRFGVSVPITDMAFDEVTIGALAARFEAARRSGPRHRRGHTESPPAIFELRPALREESAPDAALSRALPGIPLRVSTVALAGGLRLEVVEAGEGPPLLLLPPIWSTAAVWAPQIERLRDRFRLIVPHYPGCGRSPMRFDETAPARLAGHAVAVLDALGIGGAVDVTGWSLGGMVAQELAIGAPARVRRLALVSTTARLEEAESVENARDLLFRLVEDFEAGLRASADDPARLRATFELARGSSDAAVTLHYGAEVLRFDATTRVQAVRAPALIVQGREDRITPPRYGRFLADAIADSRYVEIERAGHYVPLQSADRFAGVLLAFLDARER